MYGVVGAPDTVGHIHLIQGGGAFVIPGGVWSNDNENSKGKLQTRTYTKGESVVAGLTRGDIGLGLSLTLIPGQVGLHKILFHFESFLHESIVLSFLLLVYIAHTVAILLYVDCAI